MQGLWSRPTRAGSYRGDAGGVYMYIVIKQISREILGGSIDLKPYYKDKKTPCKYCDYKSVCGFNMGGCENNYNYIDKKSKEEILAKIKKCEGK